MKQTLTLEDIDDYVQALTAFLPTPAQRKMIQEYQSAIEKNPQYQVLIQRKLAIANIPTTFLQKQTISIQEIIENTLQELKVKVQGQIEKTFSVSTYRMSFARGEDVNMNQIGIGYQDHELDLYVHPELLKNYSFILMKDGQEILPDEIIEEGGEGYIIFDHIDEDDEFEIIIKESA